MRAAFIFYLATKLPRIAPKLLDDRQSIHFGIIKLPLILRRYSTPWYFFPQFAFGYRELFKFAFVTFRIRGEGMAHASMTSTATRLRCGLATPSFLARLLNTFARMLMR